MEKSKVDNGYKYSFPSMRYYTAGNNTPPKEKCLVYMISTEDGRPLYIGRTRRRLEVRLLEHLETDRFDKYISNNGCERTRNFLRLKFSYARINTYEEQKFAEHNLIAHYQPELNIVSKNHYDTRAVAAIKFIPFDLKRRVASI